ARPLAYPSLVAKTYTRGRAVKERAKSRCTASTSAATELAITASSARLIAVSSRRSAGPVIIANSMPPTTSIVRAGGVALADGSGVGEELGEAVAPRSDGNAVGDAVATWVAGAAQAATASARISHAVRTRRA